MHTESEDKKNFVRRIPGFRSGTPWKMVLASLVYGSAFFYGLVLLAGSLLGPVSDPRPPRPEYAPGPAAPAVANRSTPAAPAPAPVPAPTPASAPEDARSWITGDITGKSAAAIEEEFRLTRSEQEALIADVKRAFREQGVEETVAGLLGGLRLQLEIVYGELLLCEGKDGLTEQQEKEVLELIKSHKVLNAYVFCNGDLERSVVDRPSFNVGRYVLARQSRHVDDLYRAYNRRDLGKMLTAAQKMRLEYNALGIR